MGKSCAQKGFFLFDKKNIKSSGKIFLDFFELFRNWWLDSWLLLKNIFFDGIQHNSQVPTLCYFWHPSDFFYRTKLSWHVQNDFLIKLNISRSAFLKKKWLFTFYFGGGYWIGENPTFSLWLAIALWGKIVKLKTR